MTMTKPETEEVPDEEAKVATRVATSLPDALQASNDAPVMRMTRATPTSEPMTTKVTIDALDPDLRQGDHVAACFFANTIGKPFSPRSLFAFRVLAIEEPDALVLQGPDACLLLASPKDDKPPTLDALRRIVHVSEPRPHSPRPPRPPAGIPHPSPARLDPDLLASRLASRNECYADPKPQDDDG